MPLGTLAQAALSPIVLRWGMAALVLVFVALLASGWRYPFKPSIPAALGAGAISGFCGGAAQLSGPPLLIYWLSSPTSAAHVRANMMVYLMLIALTMSGTYAWHGLMARSRSHSRCWCRRSISWHCGWARGCSAARPI